LRMVGPPRQVCDEYQRMVAVEGDSSAEMKFGGRRMDGDAATPAEPLPGRDHRAELIEQSALRNDIKVFEFDEAAPWYGQRLATIKSLVITDGNGQRLNILTGGEEVTIEVETLVHADLLQPIIGFEVRNRQGMTIFSDNTYLTYEAAPFGVLADTVLTARFRFQMPYLPTGDYSIYSAIANGTQTDHVQQDR
jgi:lipopolysaccharide transport system ATP-binding protein